MFSTFKSSYNFWITHLTLSGSHTQPNPPRLLLVLSENIFSWLLTPCGDFSHVHEKFLVKRRTLNDLGVFFCFSPCFSQHHMAYRILGPRSGLSLCPCTGNMETTPGMVFLWHFLSFFIHISSEISQITDSEILSGSFSSASFQGLASLNRGISKGRIKWGRRR